MVAPTDCPSAPPQAVTLKQMAADSQMQLCLYSISDNSTTAQQGPCLRTPGRQGGLTQGPPALAVLSKVQRKLCLPASPSNLRESTREGRLLSQKLYDPCQPPSAQKHQGCSEEAPGQSQGRVTYYKEPACVCGVFVCVHVCTHVCLCVWGQDVYTT